MKKKKRILVVAVHPDDETLGCGGTILRHKDEGDEVFWLTITTVEGSYYNQNDIDRRKIEIKRVKQMYNFDKSYHLNFITTKINEYSLDMIYSELAKVINEVKPNVIYLQHESDIHGEHGEIFNAVFSFTKSFRNRYVKEVYVMETLSETEFAPSYQKNVFNPNYFVDISSFMERKIEIMKIYKSELGEHPFPRSERNIRALGTLRGATAGVEYAEAFMCLKSIR